MTPTIAEAASGLRTGAWSPVALTQAALDRIARLDPALHAWVHVDGDGALAAARQAEQEIAAGGWRGPLHGIPLGIKDSIDVAGMPTTACHRGLLDNRPDRDAALVASLRERGAVLLGKNTLYELNYGGPSFDLPFPPARNPWNPERIPGGSSSGSAAAVAAGMCLGAVGTDAGGSIRQPAAFCGVAGLKPTHGLVPGEGVVPMTYSLGSAGPIAHTAEDCALLLMAMADPVPPRRDGAGLKGARIGWLRHFHEEEAEVHPAQATAMEEAERTFRDLGAVVEPARTPSPLRDMDAVGRVVLLAEAYANHEAALRADPALYGRIARHRFLLGAFLSAADVLQAQRRRTAIAREVEGMFGRWDYLLAPGEAGPAPRFEQAAASFPFVQQPSLRMPFNVSGHPACVVPCGEADGMPLALQLVGAWGDDLGVLDAAAEYGRAAGRARTPPLD